MAEKSIIDPVDRIEGHLRIEMEVENGVVSNAWVSGGLFRGLELIAEGREPDDAALVAQRICGVCPTSHCHASVYAAEEAYGIQHPEGARLVRNMLEGAQFLHSHILWFYQLCALDYVNPLNALNADPKEATKVAEQLGMHVSDFAQVQRRLQTFAENGQYSWLSGGWFMDGQAPKAYKLTPELDLIATAHYIEGLDAQATADEISAIIGGKMPHVMTSRPGGTAFYPNIERLDDILARIKQLKTFITDTLLPDALNIGKVYLDDVAAIGNNKHGHFMAYGVFDTKLNEGQEHYDHKKRVLPPGIVRMDMNTGELTLEEFDADKIEEQVKHAYYDPYEGDRDSLPPLEGQTNPPKEFPGYDTSAHYSWCKSPRYGEDYEVMEVGPLARTIVAYASGVQSVKKHVDYALDFLGIKDMRVLNSAAGRLIARPLEAWTVVELMEGWIKELVAYLANGGEDFFTSPARTTGEGVGLWEAPRGALLHCEKIKDNKITHYQAVVPTAWNIGPRDNNDVPGTIEQALIGTPVDNVKAPINALRIVHGYDPCVACAIHVVEPKTGKEFKLHTTPWGGR